MASITILGVLSNPGWGDTYGADGRTGTQMVKDGAGTHVFRVLDPANTNPPPQDIWYKFVPDGKDPASVPYTRTNMPTKTYSIDAAYIVGTRMLLEIQALNAASGKVTAYNAEATGITVTPVQSGGGGSGGGVSIADVQAWLVHQMGLTG